MSLESFLKKTALDPLKRMADDAINNFTRELTSKFENEVDKLFTKGLKSLGLSNSIASKLAARFGDALVNELADEFFQSASSEANRLSKQEICDNFAPRFAETSTQSVERLGSELKNISNTSSTALQFPSRLGKYYMSLRFKEYTRTAPFAKMTQSFKNGIILPIPRSLEDTYNLNLETAKLGGVGAAADLAMAVKENPNFSPTSQIGAMGLMLGNKLLEGASVPIGGNIGQAATNVAGQLLGTIPNPHLSVVFQGISLREHTFEWTFAPRNKEESRTLSQIILQLQRNSLPAYSKAGTAALEYPYLCQIDLYPWAGEGGNPLIKYKPAMLKNVIINYSPNGIPSFFAGTSLPTFVSLKLEFVEIEYFTSDDYGRAGRDDSKLVALVKAGGEWVDKAKEIVGAVVDGANGIMPEAASDANVAEGDGTQPPSTPAPTSTTQTTSDQVRSRVTDLQPNLGMNFLGANGEVAYSVERAGGAIRPVPGASTASGQQMTIPAYGYGIYDASGKLLHVAGTEAAVGDYLAGKVL